MVVDDGAGLRITSNVRGTNSSVVVGGNAAAAFAFNEIQAGAGNVGNIDAVTLAEFEAVVEAAFPLVDAGSFDGHAFLAVTSPGATLDIDPASAPGFGFETGPVLIVGDGRALLGVTSEHAVASVDLGTREGANRAHETLDRALDQLGAVRGALGAAHNRLTSTLSSLGVAAVNLSAARGRILDADLGEETATLARSQILQQAGTAVLAQANQTPSIALSLLSAL